MKIKLEKFEESVTDPDLGLEKGTEESNEAGGVERLLEVDIDPLLEEDEVEVKAGVIDEDVDIQIA